MNFIKNIFVPSKILQRNEIKEQIIFENEKQKWIAKVDYLEKLILRSTKELEELKSYINIKSHKDYKKNYVKLEEINNKKSDKIVLKDSNLCSEIIIDFNEEHEILNNFLYDNSKD